MAMGSSLQVTTWQEIAPGGRAGQGEKTSESLEDAFANLPKWIRATGEAAMKEEYAESI
jgi:hypothetical protein